MVANPIFNHMFFYHGPIDTNEGTLKYTENKYSLFMHDIKSVSSAQFILNA